MALAAMDVGTAFGSLGARREMLIACLAEPALLMVFFTPALISQSTELTVIVDQLAHRELRLYPSMAFAAVAFLMVLLAENARIPVDNPTTHLELTMVHEAMLLEYSARHLALMEWAHALKLMTYAAIGIALFAALGHRRGRRLGDGAAGGRRAGGRSSRWPARGWRCSRWCRRRCASSARPSSSAWRSCSRCSACSPGFWCRHEPRVRRRFHQPAGLVAAADRVRDAGAAPPAAPDPPVRPAGLRAGAEHDRGGGHHRPAAPVLFRAADPGAEGAAAALDPAPPDRPAARALGRGDPGQSVHHPAGRHRPGDHRLQPGLAHLPARRAPSPAARWASPWRACCCRS